MTGFELGAVVRDTVTGFKGVVTGRAEYLDDTPAVRVTAQNGMEDLNERWIVEARCVHADGKQTAGFGASC